MREFPKSTMQSNGGNGTIEGRLRKVEEAVVRIEAHMEHLASREFIYKAILTGFITGLGLAATITIMITRLLK